MRLGEIKNILDQYLSPEHTIVLNTEAKSGYGNQYVLIKHYDRFVFIESFLAQQGISLNVRDNFLSHLKPHNPHSEEVLIQNNVLTQINQYLNALNPFVQMFYMVISNLAKPQDPHMLNIKLPDKEDFSIKDMENLMKKLHIIFCGIADSIDIPASFDIVGVESGSKWLDVKINVDVKQSLTLFGVIMGLLSIGTKTFQTREAFFKSEEAKLSYEIMEEEYRKNIGFEEHVIRMVDKKRGNDIAEVLEKTGVNKPDAKNKMETIVVQIVEALRDGVEFHPSLNPPEYIKDEANGIKVNYEMIKEIEAEQNKPKQITEEKQEDISESNPE